MGIPLNSVWIYFKAVRGWMISGGTAEMMKNRIAEEFLIDISAKGLPAFVKRKIDGR